MYNNKSCLQHNLINSLFSFSEGGSIKTPSQADSESLQAKWVQNLSELQLRAPDILSIVEHARSFKTQLDSHQAFHPTLLPTPRSYPKLYLRLIICARRKTK